MELLHLRITPHRRIENTHVEALVRALHWYRPPIARVSTRGFAPQERAAWEILLEASGATFYLTVPAGWNRATLKQLATTWPDATVERVQDPLRSLRPAVAGSLALKQHYFLALKVDRRTLAPLESLLEVTRLLEEGEAVAVQTLLDPAPRDWWTGAAQAYEAARRGEIPRRLELDTATVVHVGVRTLAGVALEGLAMVREFLGDDDQPEEFDLDAGLRAQMLRDGPLSAATLGKIRGDGFDVCLRVAVQCEDARKAESILRSVAFAYRDLDGDNSLALHGADPSRTLSRMQARSPGLKLNHDYIGIAEASRLLVLPPAQLQQRYHMASVQLRETDLPKALTSGGLYLGTHTYHGAQIPVYLPTSDLDETCLPHVVTGAQGSGKTKGFGANLVVEAVRAGYGAIVIDPARGEIGDEVESALSAEQVVRVRFGEKPIGLDWREALTSRVGRSRLASEVVGFFESGEGDVGYQTEHHLRSAAKVAPSGRLDEILRVFTDGAYRERLMGAMAPNERAVWQAYHRLSDARQAQITAPVWNRLGAVLDDDYLQACAGSRSGIDFVELTQEPRAVIVDVPKAHLDAESVNVLAALMASKVHVAMYLRKSTHPVFVVLDEPHAYLRSARTWRTAVVEARKYRFAYTFLFHYFDQLPKEIQKAVIASGPHYHLYPTSKETYRDLAEEIAPFTLEEAMATPRHHAINVIRAGGTTAPPFVAKMAAPPSMRRERQKAEGRA